MDWDFYQSTLEHLRERPVFVTFKEGTLELMSPSWKHDSRGRTIGYMIRVLAEEFQVPLQAGGSVTLRSEPQRLGLEPDECFYTKHIESVRGISRIDLDRDPPPDLAVEVEISSRLSGRLEIYAAFGVPELWRYDGSQLRVYSLNTAKQYMSVNRSPTFPLIDLDGLTQQLELSASSDLSTWGLSFRQWVQQQRDSQAT